MFTARVVRVVDGDTIKVTIAGYPMTVRLLGIDTPETVKPGTPVECGGRPATVAMRRLASVGERVRLVTDSTQSVFDRYGRLLAYVYGSDHRLVETEILRLGWAKVYVYQRRFKRYTSFMSAQHSAQDRNLGIWAHCGGRAHRRL